MRARQPWVREPGRSLATSSSEEIIGQSAEANDELGTGAASVAKRGRPLAMADPRDSSDVVAEARRQERCGLGGAHHARACTVSGQLAVPDRAADEQLA